MDSYSSHEGQIYCKPHFKQLFQPKPIFDNNNNHQNNHNQSQQLNGVGRNDTKDRMLRIVSFHSKYSDLNNFKDTFGILSRNLHCTVISLFQMIYLFSTMINFKVKTRYI